MHRTLSLILLLCFALAAAGCSTTVAVSGRVVIEGGQPLANHEVALYAIRRPWVPLGMGSYVKRATVRTDANGCFSISAAVPENLRFELRTENPATVFGGGSVSLKPASSITDVTIVHRRD